MQILTSSIENSSTFDDQIIFNHSSSCLNIHLIFYRDLLNKITILISDNKYFKEKNINISV